MYETVAMTVVNTMDSLWLHTFEILVAGYVLVDLIRNERERIRRHRLEVARTHRPRVSVSKRAAKRRRR